MWYFEIFVTIPIRCFGSWTGWGDFWFCRYWYKNYNRNDLNFCAKIGWMHYINMYCIPTKEIHRWKRINTNALMYERFLLLSHDQARHGDQKHFFSISFLKEKSYIIKEYSLKSPFEKSFKKECNLRFLSLSKRDFWIS